MSALVELAGRGADAPTPILEVAEARQIALHVLEQLFASLRRAGILKSQRGVHGGYSFAGSPRDVTVLDVVECVDGPLRPGPSDSSDIWTDAQQMLAELLEATTIATLVEREARAAGTLMFHI